MTHWIIAPVVLPALVAALIVLAARKNLFLARLLGMGTTLALLAVSAALLLAASDGPELYRLGDWPAPFGIVLVLDRLSALMLVLTQGLAALVLWQAIATGWDARGAHFHALWLFQLMGLNGAFLTGDAFNLFVFFEVLLIASYGLMVHGGGAQRTRAGLQYVAVNLVGSTLFLFALASVYSITGTLNMADLSLKIAALPQGDWALIRVAAVLMVTVFAIKGALVPLHFWLPGTYANAPGVVAALFAVMTKVGAYATIRAGTLIFPATSPAIGDLLQTLLLPAALLTIAVGSIGVLGSRSLPRQAAFAALASMGTVFAAIAVFDTTATTAALYYMVHSTLAGALLFLLADLCHDDQTQGKRPHGALAALFLLAAIASAGLPPLSGFLGKLMVLQASSYPVWPVVLGGSFLMILGFARTGSATFWKPAPAAAPPAAATLAIPLALVVAMAALTVLAGPGHAWLTATAQGLTDPAAYIAVNALP